MGPTTRWRGPGLSELLSLALFRRPLGKQRLDGHPHFRFHDLTLKIVSRPSRAMEF